MRAFFFNLISALILLFLSKVWKPQSFLPGLPWSCGESVGFGGERADGTDVDDVTRQLRHEHLLDVRSDLQIISPPRRSQVLHTGNLAAKAATNVGIHDVTV